MATEGRRGFIVQTDSMGRRCTPMDANLSPGRLSLLAHNNNNHGGTSSRRVAARACCVHLRSSAAGVAGLCR
jgi:hypothetical protein